VNGLSAVVRRYVAPSAAALAAVMIGPALAEADGPSDEQKFVAEARQLPAYVLPQGDRSTDGDILAGGYQACAALDQFPTDSTQAARVYFRGGNTVDGQITYDGQMFMTYAAEFLCNRHSHLYDNF
jgi:serine/threonine-protein kinase